MHDHCRKLKGLACVEDPFSLTFYFYRHFAFKHVAGLRAGRFLARLCGVWREVRDTHAHLPVRSRYRDPLQNYGFPGRGRLGVRPLLSRVLTKFSESGVVGGSRDHSEYCKKEERLHRLQSISAKPYSVTALAKKLGRDLRSVGRDMVKLEQYGVVRTREKINPGMDG